MCVKRYVGGRLKQWQPINGGSEPYKSSCRLIKCKHECSVAPLVLAPLLSPEGAQVELVSKHYSLICNGDCLAPDWLWGGMQGKTQEQLLRRCPASHGKRAQQQQQQLDKDIFEVVNLVSSSDDEEEERGEATAAARSSVAKDQAAPWKGHVWPKQPEKPVKAPSDSAGLASAPVCGRDVSSSEHTHKPGAGASPQRCDGIPSVTYGI